MERLGLSVPTELPLADLPTLARRAEELGYTDAWSMEANALDAFTPLAAVAVVTRRMRLGTAIVPATTRPAGLLAMHAAAMAELAPGRFVLGLGSSTRAIVEGWFGFPFSAPVSRTRQVAQEVQALLAGERVGAMKLQRPANGQVPLYLAALGPGMLRLAGEVAEGVVFFLTGPRIIPRLLEEVGKPVDSVARLIVVPGEGADARMAARRSVVTYALVPYYQRSLERQGFGEEVAAIQMAWLAGDREGACRQVSDAMLDELVLVGSEDRIRDRLEDYRRAGLRTPVLAFGFQARGLVVARSDLEHLLAALAPVA